ncbi:hypothetical protein DERF_004678 [Dermatophagoides farinae]|uniref:Uncharacterized protein n=1 Tax=Dermatophagoides farinae TaxID=6954 RepID=A0A922L6F7_DERFA|nr:hypothetical protein DERF_004678 [Dermatophagoides farinae]
MTTTANPKLLISLALAMKSASPSFRLIELTTPLPWQHLRPASITSNLEESIQTGTRQISGSVLIRFKKLAISLGPSIIPSSMLTSNT